MKIESKDNWSDKKTFACRSCMWFVMKAEPGSISMIGRCRRHAPTMNGYPVTYESDWCGDHKMDASKFTVAGPCCRPGDD